MHTIEPCCAERQLQQLRQSAEQHGSVTFEGFGDFSLTELLPALLTRYSEAQMMIVAPSIPLQASEIIRKWMNRQWARMDGRGKVDVIKQLTLIADLSPEESPEVCLWKDDNPFHGRLTLHHIQQTETAILFQNFAIVGPVNLRYGKHFVATAFYGEERVESLWHKYMELTAVDSKKVSTRKRGVKKDHL